MVLAVGAAWSGVNRLAFILAGVRQVFACYGIAAALGVVVRVGRTEDVIVPPTRSELFIGNLGVSPERRGGGIGAALIKQLIAQNRRSGITKAVMDVAVINPRAQQLYERLSPGERPGVSWSAIGGWKCRCDAPAYRPRRVRWRTASPQLRTHQVRRRPAFRRYAPQQTDLVAAGRARWRHFEALALGS